MYEKGIAEKLYLQLDKPYYSAGENIWFKGYLVNAVTLAPMRQSRYIYVELIDRNNTVQQRIKIRADEHGFHNCLKLPPETPREQYTLRAYTQWMRNSGEAFFYNRILTIGNPIDNAVSATIRYTTEENGQCTAEIVFTDSEKKPIADQKLTYLLALDGKTKRYSAQTTQRGKLLVGFPIPQQDMASNSLTVTIDDPNMPYEKQFIIPAFSQDYSVDFFPEGGHLLPLGMQTVAFKAIGTNGLSVEVNGQIVDGEGTPVTTFNTIHKGMGRLSFVPQSGKRYFAETLDSAGLAKRFELPPVSPSGCTLAVTERNGLLLCQATATPDIDPAKLGLVVHVKGQVIAVDPLASFPSVWSVGKQSLPPGIAHFSIVDQDTGQPVAERLYFIHETSSPQAAFATNSNQYGAREKVTLTIHLKDTTGQSSGSFAVAVTDRHAVQQNPDDGDIRSNLLLTSDLKGHIEEPGYYFYDRTPQKDHKLDLLMLTHGWTRFNISDLLKGRLPEAKFPVEESQTVSGEVLGMFGGAPKSTTVTICSLKDSYVEELPLGNTNKFLFPNCDFADSTTLLLQSKRAKGGTTGLELKIDPETFPDANAGIPLPKIGENPTDSTFIPLEYLDQLKEQYYAEGGIRIINLSNVTVTAQRKHMFNGQYVERVIGQEILNHFKGTSQLSEAMSYLRMSNVYDEITGEHTIVPNRSGAGAIDCFVVDDRKVSAQMFNNIPPNRVEAMGYLEPGEAGRYGAEARYGAIVVRLKEGYTLNNVFDTPTLATVTVTPLGYKKPEAFYAPKYETSAAKADNNPDLRTTVYWDPCVKPDRNGKISLTFYTADKATVYDVILEGITDNGSICRATTTIDRTR